MSILNDGLAEGTQTFALDVMLLNGDMVKETLATTTIEIQDNDPGVSFANSEFYANEN